MFFYLNYNDNKLKIVKSKNIKNIHHFLMLILIPFLINICYYINILTQ